jgi:hypothetical protein
MIATLCNRPKRGGKSTVSKGKDVPLPMLLLMAGSAIDLDFNQSRPARALRVKFESLANEYAVSKWLWRNLRSRCCSLCQDGFDFDHRDDKLKYSVAIDSVGVHLLHRSCAATLPPLGMHVLFEGYQYPDTQHYLTVNYRGYAPRVVIGNTRSTTRAALLQVVREIADGRMVLRPPAGGEGLIQ